MTEHWQASTAQQERIARFETWLLAYVEAARAEQRLDDEVRAIYESGKEAPMCVALQSAFGNDCERHLADFYLFPALHRRTPNLRACTNHIFNVSWNARDINQLLTASLRLWAGNYTCSLALQRLRFQLRHPADASECIEPPWMGAERARLLKDVKHAFLADEINTALNFALKRSGNPFLEPDPSTLADELCQWEASPEQLDELMDLMERSCDTFVDETYAPPEQVEDVDVSARTSTAQLFLVAYYASDLAGAYARLGSLDASRVRRLFDLAWPVSAGLLLDCLREDEERGYLKPFKPEALERVYALCSKPLSEALAALGHISDASEYSHDRGASRLLSGWRFVLAGARLLAQMPSPPPTFDLVKSETQRPAAHALKLLCNVQPLDAAERAELIDALKLLPKEILLQLLRHSRAQADEVLAALGWGDAAPLYRFMVEREKAEANDFFDVPLLQSLLQRAGESGELLLAWNKKYKHLTVTVRRIEAVRGVEDVKLAGLLERLSQEHIRLWALYPIKDPADLRQRFDYFKSAGKLASKQFGSERTANVRDAAAAALVQLADNAGFGDVTEMEWSLDAGSQSATDWTWQDGEYAVELKLEAFQPVLAVHKAGKALKSLPPALKKTPELAPLLAQFDLLKDQAKRYRIAMENLMVGARVLRPEQLQELSRLPLAQQMLTALYMQDPGGALGVLEEGLTQWRLLGDDGALAKTAQPVSAPLRIAHVHDLLRAGRLIDCQRHAVQAGLVQPFKQAFRECYVLTPAEREAGDASQRFQGRRVKTSVLGAVLSARGWRFDGGGGYAFIARKRVSPDVFVEVSLPDVYQYLTQEEATVLGEVCFTRQGARIALDEAPALGFSEAMRDLDLVITAGAADSDEHSLEVQQARVALVSALIPTLGLNNVSVEGHHAIIQGMRASYRLHLGTAVIHVIPAGYLCIVPAGKAGTRSAVALPFADEDQRTSEVLSKLLLLCADDKIKDPGIIAQIEGRATTA